MSRQINVFGLVAFRSTNNNCFFRFEELADDGFGHLVADVSVRDMEQGTMPLLVTESDLALGRTLPDFEGHTEERVERVTFDVTLTS